MEAKPITASQGLVSAMCSKMAAHVSMNPSAEKFSPSRDLTWVVAMVMAEDEVNPAMTGVAMKSMNIPKVAQMLLPV
jgi:hypothetical protein